MVPQAFSISTEAYSQVLNQQLRSTIEVALCATHPECKKVVMCVVSQRSSCPSANSTANSARSNTRGCQHNGTYTWPVVRAKHIANLTYVVDDLPGWEVAMLAELAAPRFTNRWVRVHDSGDFFSDDYLAAWLRICRARPETNFYCYTKEVRRFRRMVEPDPPENFRWVYSFGGTHDAELSDADRVADVFPDSAAISAAGWASQEASDLLAVLGPQLVGIPANRIPRALKLLQDRSFRSWQAEVDAERASRPARRRREIAVERRAA